MYKVGQHNKMRRCLTTSKAYIVLKKPHGMVGGDFVEDITTNKILNAGY